MWEILFQQFSVGLEESGVQIIKLSASYARLAQGHARLLNHDQVTICDAINAIILLEVSYDSNPSFLPEINLLHFLCSKNVLCFKRSRQSEVIRQVFSRNLCFLNPLHFHLILMIRRHLFI